MKPRPARQFRCGPGDREPACGRCGHTVASGALVTDTSLGLPRRCPLVRRDDARRLVVRPRAAPGRQTCLPPDRRPPHRIRHAVRTPGDHADHHGRTDRPASHPARAGVRHRGGGRRRGRELRPGAGARVVCCVNLRHDPRAHIVVGGERRSVVAPSYYRSRPESKDRTPTAHPESPSR